jgi:ubiquinone/menaquinone biosynthesis C-methylase UbiE
MSTVKCVSKAEWEDNQKYERHEWAENVFIVQGHTEVDKQNFYSEFMGITDSHVFEKIDLNGKSILDIGCGPVSLLLRCYNFSRAVGVEPLFYGTDVDTIYKNHGVSLVRLPAEELSFEEQEFDEVWMYNCLQHVYDPTLILDKISKFGKTLRIFEWLDIPPHTGHPHEFNAEYFIKTLNLSPSEYKIHYCTDNLLVGKCIAVCKNYN